MSSKFLGPMKGFCALMWSYSLIPLALASQPFHLLLIYLIKLLAGSEVIMEDAATSPFLDVIVPLHKHLLAWLPSWPQLYF